MRPESIFWNIGKPPSGPTKTAKRNKSNSTSFGLRNWTFSKKTYLFSWEGATRAGALKTKHSTPSRIKDTSSSTTLGMATNICRRALECWWYWPFWWTKFSSWAATFSKRLWKRFMARRETYGKPYTIYLTYGTSQAGPDSWGPSHFLRNGCSHRSTHHNQISWGWNAYTSWIFERIEENCKMSRPSDQIRHGHRILVSCAVTIAQSNLLKLQAFNHHSPGATGSLKSLDFWLFSCSLIWHIENLGLPILKYRFKEP